MTEPAAAIAPFELAWPEPHLRLVLDIEPQPWRPPRVTRRRTYLEPRYARWKARATELALAELQRARRRRLWPWKPWERMVVVRVDLVRARPQGRYRRCDPDGRIPIGVRPDWDNCAKAAVDAALVGTGAIADDGQVWMGLAAKWYAARDERPRVEMAVWRVEG